MKLYDEEIEEIEESESDSEEEEAEAELAPAPTGKQQARETPSSMSQDPILGDAPFPISAIATPSDVDMLGVRAENDEASEMAEEEEDGLFAGGDDEDEESDAMEEVSTALVDSSGGPKRNLVEDEDYD